MIVSFSTQIETALSHDGCAHCEKKRTQTEAEALADTELRVCIVQETLFCVSSLCVEFTSSIMMAYDDQAGAAVAELCVKPNVTPHAAPPQ